MSGIGKRNLFYVVGTIVTASWFSPADLHAQEAVGGAGGVLDEVVVTAQRRVQSLQDVPLSIETFGSEEIQKQNFRNPNDLAKFSPTVYINTNEAKMQTILVRGIGTTGNSLHLEQAVPMFIDGVHFGRQSMAKLGFMDLERVEIMKGPQPVYFGMNAIGGAINLISRKPTPTWEGTASVEVGNNDTTDTEFGIGGPITDTLGIRVAGKYERSAGFMWDVLRHVTGPSYENMGGRVTLQWEPTDSFSATAKVAYSEMNSGGDVFHLCLIPGSLIHGRNAQSEPGEGDEDAIWADPPKGVGSNLDFDPLSYDCYGNNQGLIAGGPYYAPPNNIREQNMNAGFLDIREIGVLDEPTGTLDAFEHHDVLDGYLNLQYVFDSGIAADLNVAAIDYFHDYFEDNSASPFLTNSSSRAEDFNQYSTELRFTSPADGRIVWMAGLFGQWQKNENFSNSYRANVRRGNRFNDLSQDSKWLNAFASVTFNFLDDRMSLDVGGRYTKVKKDVFANGYGRQWVYDVAPCHPDEPLPADPDNCTLGLHPDAIQITAADTSVLLQDADITNLWTMPWETSREVPATWRGGEAHAVGLTLRDYSAISGVPDTGRFVSRSESNFDPQVVLRYRPTDDISTFVRWATAFKAGGFDTGKTSLPPIDEFEFGPETAETYEVGVKSTFWDGRARFDLTAFTLSVEGLQLSTAALDPEEDSRSVNAGEQRVRGVEGSVTVAVTDRLTLNLAGAFMDGEMVDFRNAGCSDDEFENAPESGCDVDTRLIDRSGQEAVRTPTYKVVLTADYWMPVFNDYRVAFNAKGYVSDDYVIDLANEHRYPASEDLNARVSFGDQNETWFLSFYAKNILEARDSYDPEADAIPNGLLTAYMGQDNFMSYGAEFRYNFY